MTAQRIWLGTSCVWFGVLSSEVETCFAHTLVGQPSVTGLSLFPVSGVEFFDDSSDAGSKVKTNATVMQLETRRLIHPLRTEIAATRPYHGTPRPQRRHPRQSDTDRRAAQP